MSIIVFNGTTNIETENSRPNIAPQKIIFHRFELTTNLLNFSGFAHIYTYTHATVRYIRGAYNIDFREHASVYTYIRIRLPMGEFFLPSIARASRIVYKSSSEKEKKRAPDYNETKYPAYTVIYFRLLAIVIFN